MTKPWYDTPAGIESRLTSLEGLHQIINARSIAYYRRHETLNEFIIMGRWRLDSCGNCAIASATSYSIIPKEQLPCIPDVLTESDFWDFLKANRMSDSRVSWVFGGGSAAIADPIIACSACGQSWDLTNCHDCQVERDHFDRSLEDFVCQSIGELRHYLRTRTDAVYFLPPDHMIRNDRCIDLSPNPQYPKAVVNQYGWLGQHQGLTDDYIIQPGDTTTLFRELYYHPSCYAAKLAAETEQGFKDIFVTAGFVAEDLVITATANQYGSLSYNGPWFEVQTSIGQITIGWRKRVMEINWSGTKHNLLHLFDDVDNTKDPTCIHAWDVDQAVDYLSRIRLSLTS